jgi:hypothetical protein
MRPTRDSDVPITGTITRKEGGNMGAVVRGRKPPTGEPLLERAFRLLAAFRPGDRSLSLTAMSARAHIPKSSALRIARQLVDCGALERRDDAEFVIGLRLLEIASLAPRGHGLRQTALPFMEDLHVATGQHVLLAVRDGTEAVLVERLSTRGAGKVLYRVGGRMPLRSRNRCWPATSPSFPKTGGCPNRSCGRSWRRRAGPGLRWPLGRPPHR